MNKIIGERYTLGLLLYSKSKIQIKINLLEEKTRRQLYTNNLMLRNFLTKAESFVEDSAELSAVIDEHFKV